ncbi:synergin gamma [Galendromus occidentalis]|uniref:Synergin gamma n=1 Tax=Galendromus occidentalis TaxID=34638 RepID=A0AAJ6W0M1_9ACAR|nr:synergin gamma [Galendromus occidentalis]
MDPLKSFEKKLLSGSLIDASKLKQNRPSWLDPSRVPRIYRDLEALVTVPNGVEAPGERTPLDTAKVYQLLLASGLPQPILASIWEQCSRAVPGILVRHEFYQSLALVALCQVGKQPNLQLLPTLPSAPIPQLAIPGYPLPLAAVVQPQIGRPIPPQVPDATSSTQQTSIEPTVSPKANGNPLDLTAVTTQSAEDEDDFAEFQSAPSRIDGNRSAADPIPLRISVPEALPSEYLVDRSSISSPLAPVTIRAGDPDDLLPTSSQIKQSSPCQKIPKSTIAASSPKQLKVLPSASLFDSITFPVAENVQPPSESNPWLGFSLEAPGGKSASKKTVRKAIKDARHEAPLAAQINSTTQKESAVATNGVDDGFDDFDDFQSAPVEAQNRAPGPDSETSHAKDFPSPPDEDKYSVFRLLDGSPDECPDGESFARESDAHPTLLFPAGEREQKPSRSSAPSASTSSGGDGGVPVDILSLIKLPSIPAVESSFDGDLSQFDLLSLSAGDEVTNRDSTSALIELQDIDIGFLAVDGPVASHPSSVEASPAKSVASGMSIGESRGGEKRLSLFTSKANYAECASLSSFELGPSTESNYSSPTKGSIVSLELNSRSPPDDENGDEDDTLEWTIEAEDAQAPRASESTSENKRRGSDEFCWAQPPMFPPPDPTDLGKNSALPSTGLFLQNFPENQSKEVTRQQVADGWQRILSKAAAILESASVILGDDPVVLGEILSTAKGQAYIASLLEVYNVTQQLKKSADLHGVRGLSTQLKQVDDTWRGKLDDLATRLHLSVVCMDHLSSPIRAEEDICAICSLPLTLRLPQILFGDNGYHSSCANFWANVLAEGLPCLKLSP